MALLNLCLDVRLVGSDGGFHANLLSSQALSWDLSPGQLGPLRLDTLLSAGPHHWGY